MHSSACQNLKHYIIHNATSWPTVRSDVRCLMLEVMKPGAEMRSELQTFHFKVSYSSDMAFDKTT